MTTSPAFLNYTPHAINVVITDPAKGETREICYLSDGVARVTEIQEIVGTHDGVELRATRYGTIEGLPDPQPDNSLTTRYIVSMLVRQVNERSPHPRSDLVSPDTDRSCIRDEKNQIKAVTGFCV
jgi:hypothetical protein